MNSPTFKAVKKSSRNPSKHELPAINKRPSDEFPEEEKLDDREKSRVRKLMREGLS